jgi:ADP-heptose:LPS heptosyltransferase
MALWHEGGLGDVIDSAHLAIALRRAYKPDYFAYYLRKPVQNDLLFCLHWDGKPVFDGTLQTDIPWEDCVEAEGSKWDSFIDWKPYIPIEYETPGAGITDIRFPRRAKRTIPEKWELLYRDMFKSPYLNKLHDEKTSLHELACAALRIEPASIDELEVRIDAPVRAQIKWLCSRPYITLGPGSDTQQGRRVPQTKEWPDHRWEQVIQIIRHELPGLRVIQLGQQGEARIRGTTSLVGKTSIAELLWILKRSSLHMACENGTVRMARACGVESVVVFGPTSHYLYGMNNNTAIHSQACEPCFWKTKDWMVKCPNDWDALCMASIPSDEVAEVVLRRLEKDAA